MDFVKKITLQTPISIYCALIKYLTLLSAAALQIYDQRFFESLLSPTKTAFSLKKKTGAIAPALIIDFCYSAFGESPNESLYSLTEFSMVFSFAEAPYLSTSTTFLGP